LRWSQEVVMAARTLLLFSAFSIVWAQTPPSAHFTIGGQGVSTNDGQTVAVAAPVNGSAAVSLSSTSLLGNSGIATYAWKNNGNSICTSLPTCSVTLTSPTNTISLVVTDNRGQTSIASAQVNVTFLRGPQAHLAMTSAAERKSDGQSLTVKVP